jgi:hypothetical protein
MALMWSHMVHQIVSVRTRPPKRMGFTFSPRSGSLEAESEYGLSSADRIEEDAAADRVIIWMVIN